MDFEKYYKLVQPRLEKAVKTKSLNLRRIAELLQKRLDTLNDVDRLVDFFDTLPDYGTDLYVHKKMKTTEEIAKDSLIATLPILEGIEDWTEENIHNSLMNLVTELGIKNGQLLWPVRTALSGEPTSPGGAIELAEILGKDETIRRIKIGIEKLQ